MRLACKTLGFLLMIPLGAVNAQCRPVQGSNEAKLLAFYSAPLTFSFLRPAETWPLGNLRLIGEGVPVPRPDPALQKTGACFTPKSENTSLSPAFGRPRVAILLPHAITVEASYLPPVTIADATPNLFGMSVSRLFLIPGMSQNTNLSVRAHVTRGSVKGPITCPRKSLQSNNATSPCYGTQQSRDTFRPNSSGVEVAISAWSPDKANAGFVGAGENWLKPRFQVGFTSGTGNVDNTVVEVDLKRTVLFAGYSRRITAALDATAEVYSVPSDATLLRIAVSYLLF